MLDESASIRQELDSVCGIERKCQSVPASVLLDCEWFVLEYDECGISIKITGSVEYRLHNEAPLIVYVSVFVLAVYAFPDFCQTTAVGVKCKAGRKFLELPVRIKVIA